LPAVSSIIDHQTTKYNWLTIYTGTGLNKFHDKQSQSIGIRSVNTKKFASSSFGTRSLYSSVSAGMSNYRVQDVGEIGAAASYNFFDPANQQPVQPTIDTPVVPTTQGDTLIGIGAPSVDGSLPSPTPDTK
jgi:hypothetical protein